MREWKVEGLREEKEAERKCSPTTSPDLYFPVHPYGAGCALFPVFSFCEITVD